MASSPEHQLLQSLSQDPTLELSSTIESLVQLTQEAAKRTQNDDPRALENHIWQLWTSLLTVAASTPRSQQAGLVKFVSQLSATSVTDPASGHSLQHDDGPIWTGLPTLGWVARDEWNFDVLDHNATAQDLERWENKTAFLAQLTVLPDASESNHLDFSLYALWAFRDAFEGSVEKPLPAAVRAASLWFTYAAEKLWVNVKEERAVSGNAGAPGKQYEGKNWPGFNQERWTIWQQGLDAAVPADAGSADLVAEAKDAINRATSA